MCSAVQCKVGITQSTSSVTSIVTKPTSKLLYLHLRVETSVYQILHIVYWSRKAAFPQY